MNSDQTSVQKKSEDPELLTQLAINAALSSNWTEAAKLNQKILSLDADNIEALNRLAKALMCEGHIEKAQKTYKKVLDLDCYNIIAKKNMEKITKLSGNQTPAKTNGHSPKDLSANGHINISNVFLTEPGKTKTINLLNLASPAVLASLNCGDRVELLTKKHSVNISTLEGIYLGALPDDLSFKLLTFIGGGNKYEAFVKYATTKSLTILIREVERSTRYANQPSFHDSANPDERDGFFA